MVDRATHALHPRRVVLRVPGPGYARGQRGVHQGPHGRGRVHDVSVHRPPSATLTNVQTGKTITEKMNGPGKFFGNPDGSSTEVHTGRNGPFPLAPADAKRFGLPPA